MAQDRSGRPAEDGEGAPSRAAAVRAALAEALGRFDPRGRIVVASHNDADGLSAAAILARALGRAGNAVQPRVFGRGENPWAEAFRAELAADRPAGLIVADLGTRPGAILTDQEVPA